MEKKEEENTEIRARDTGKEKVDENTDSSKFGS
jgi:hypothetical protein